LHLQRAQARQPQLSLPTSVTISTSLHASTTSGWAVPLRNSPARCAPLTPLPPR
jgi:hypothetical protein